MNYSGVYIFDFEVFKHDWLVVFMSAETGEFYVFHNDNGMVYNFLAHHQPHLCGFNSKHYDNYILKAVLNNCSPEEIKEVNDWIIVEGLNGWENPYTKYAPQFDSFDLMDDMQVGMSLKAIEAHLGMNIQETEVDFNIDRPLTQAEIDLTTKYCKADVKATFELFKLRQSYLDTKIFIGGLRGLSVREALKYTNAKLTAIYLKARKNISFDDEREYQISPKLNRKYIPKEVIDFFEPSVSIPNDEFFKRSLVLYEKHGLKITISFGGIHGAIEKYRETATPTRVIVNLDVGSYYPHLMTLMGFCSRKMANPNIYAELLEERMAAKKSGDKVKANALKLPANTTYGAMLDKSNDLYDARMGRSVCINGQLFLLELYYHITDECPSAIGIQLNTDGLMLSIDVRELAKMNEIYHEWESRTGFELEEDKISEIIQKDVNNYIEIQTDDSVKKKGGALVRGIAPAGAWNVNNNAMVIANAVKDYLVYGIPVEKTIGENNEWTNYQLIAKASGKYSRVYQIINGEEIAQQRVNRVFATSDKGVGTLFKVHKETNRKAKIAGLPEHCYVENTTDVDMSKVDKAWYIKEAKKVINSFIGKSTPTETVENIKHEILQMIGD